MKIQIPVEVLDENCVNCYEMDIRTEGATDLWAGDRKVSRVADIRCANINLCRRLKQNIEEAFSDDRR